MGRTPCCNAEGLKKGAWAADEDQKLISYIQANGEGGWRTLPQKAGLQRCGKSCRLRWANYLRPDIKRGKFSPEEDQSIIRLHATRGNKWSVIARHLPGRTDNEIKNYWNTHLKKRLVLIGPVTHKPIVTALSPQPQNNSVNVANPDHTLELSARPPEPQPSAPSQSSSSRSISVSSLLLNKVATKLSQSASHAALSELIEGGSGSNNATTVATYGVSNIPNVQSPAFSFSSTDRPSRISRSSSTCRLLNKMATTFTTVREMLSTTIEFGPTDCRASYGLDGFDVKIGNSFYLECSTSASTPASLSENAVLEMSIAASASAGGLMATSTLSPSCYDLDMPNGDNWQECGITGDEGSANYNLEDMGINDCCNIEQSPLSTMNSVLQDQQFDFADGFLDKCGGQEVNDPATNMGFDSQDALTKNIESSSFMEELTDFLLDDPHEFSENSVDVSACSYANVGENEGGTFKEINTNYLNDDLLDSLVF